MMWWWGCNNRKNFLTLELFDREYPRVASFLCLRMGLDEDFRNRLEFWPLDFVFPTSFWRECGTNEDFTCRSEKYREGTAYSSAKAPPSHCSQQENVLGCPVCQPFSLFLACYQCCLMDVFLFLSWLYTIILFSMHHQLPACDRAVLSIPCCLQNLRVKVGWIGNPFSHPVACTCFCSRSM